MKLAILLVMLGVTVSAAAPRTVVNVELDHDQLDSSTWSRLVDVEAEPGGLRVPADADASWFRIGLKPGDIIRYNDGDPVAPSLSIGHGLSVLEVTRGKQTIVLRVLVHGPARLDLNLDSSDFRGLVDRVADPDPRVTPVRKNKRPSGVRVIDYLIGLYMSLDLGDIVRTIRGTPIYDQPAFVAALEQLPVGKSEMIIERFGRTVTVEITREPPVDLSTIKRISATRFDLPRATFDAIQKDIRLLEHRIETVAVVKDGAVIGVRLYNVQSDSACAALGLKEDDVLIEIDGRSVGSFDSIYAGKTHLAGSQVTIRVERNHKLIEITYVVR